MLSYKEIYIILILMKICVQSNLFFDGKSFRANHHEINSFSCFILQFWKYFL